MSSEENNLLDPKSMDGPLMKWAPADVFKSDPRTFMTYHVMSAGYDAFTPLGCAVGGILYGMRWRPFPSALSMMGTVGLVAGCTGMLVGLGGMQKKAKMGDGASPPWND